MNGRRVCAAGQRSCYAVDKLKYTKFIIYERPSHKLHKYISVCFGAAFTQQLCAV